MPLRATAYQKQIALAHGIPQEQAHTINCEKCDDYFKYCCRPETRLERYFDSLMLSHLLRDIQWGEQIRG